MHIAWLGKKSPFCGNVTYGREVTNNLLDRGNRVSFLHFAEQEGEEGAESECEEVVLPFLYKSQIYTIPTPGSSKVLMRSLKELQPDIVHASLTLSPLDFVLPEICQSLGLPLVATFHPAFDNQLRNLASSTQYLTYQLYAPSLANYDRVIVFSEAQKNLLIKLGVPPKKLAIIPNGVDEVKYSPGRSNVKERFLAEYLVVYQGRIAAEKNVESLLKAWKACRFPQNCKLLILGDGPLAASLRLFYGEEQGIIWLGFEANEQKRIDILRGADIFILPSLVEGLSLSLLEAMACGTGCLATDVGADAEVIEKGAGIVLKPQRVVSELKTLLPVLKEQPEWTKSLGQKGRQRVLERYTLTANITTLEELYSQVIHEGKLQLGFVF